MVKPMQRNRRLRLVTPGPAARPVADVLSIRLPGGRLLTGRAWAGEGDPLVLLHGLFDSSEGWSGLVSRTHRPCLAFDLPGFGGSDLPDAPAIGAYADAIAFALEQLGVQDATLVGHSLGGAVAAEVAARVRCIDSLVLLAPAGFGRIRLAEVMSLPVIADVATLALPLALVNPMVVSGAYAAFVAHGHLPERELVTQLRRRARSAPLGVRSAVVAMAAAGRQQRRRLRFDGHVAALWGTDDALVPVGHADGVRAALPQAEVEFWPGMGHHPQRERVAELVQFIEGRAALAGRASVAELRAAS
jgi:pimeloyl-ACP methyl ester carboxylesterase